MIVRILHEGQYELRAEGMQQLNDLDQQAFDAVTEGDDKRFRALFERILSAVRTQGKPLAMDDLRPSELILPAPDATLEEVRSLFAQEGLLQPN